MMRTTIKTFSFIMIFLLLSTACENFLDVNTDPTSSPTSTVELTLPAGMASVAFVMSGTWQILGSLWSQHWAQSPGASQYAPLDDYNINENTYSAQYTELYSGALNDLDWVSKRAEETGDWNYYLIAEVMKAYTFQVLVDFYDKVPYSEALQGSANLTPKFDDGEEIYDDLILKIDNALSKDRTEITAREVGVEDLMFQGDMEQWVRFANTLKLKIFMRQSSARPTIAQAGIQALFNSGAKFLETKDGEMDMFIDVEDYRNPFYATQISTAGAGRGYADIAASATLLNRLQANGDPRLNAIYATPVAGGAHVGIAQGDYTNTAFGTSRNLSQPKISPSQPAVLISVSESKFLQAEAVVRYGVAGDAQQLYEDGIEASFVKLGLTGAAALYGPGEVYEYNAGTAIEQIITQKWIAMANFQGVEAHFEFKRTGFPNFFTIPPNNVTGGIYPRRLPYPSIEIDNNRSNLNSIGGQRLVTERVWWNPA